MSVEPWSRIRGWRMGALPQSLAPRRGHKSVTSLAVSRDQIDIRGLSGCSGD